MNSFSPISKVPVAVWSCNVNAELECGESLNTFTPQKRSTGLLPPRATLNVGHGHTELLTLLLLLLFLLLYSARFIHTVYECKHPNTFEFNPEMIRPKYKLFYGRRYVTSCLVSSFFAYEGVSLQCFYLTADDSIVLKKKKKKISTFLTYFTWEDNLFTSEFMRDRECGFAIVTEINFFTSRFIDISVREI